MENKLKPCPFCGEIPTIIDCDLGWHISCNNDCCHVQPDLYDTYHQKEKAIEAWNDRPEPKWQTVEEWEKENGESYPYDGPVYWYHFGWEEWSVACPYEEAKEESSKIVIPIIGKGKPQKPPEYL